MNTKRMILIVCICSVVRAEPEKCSNFKRVIEILGNTSNATIKLVDLNNNTKTNGSDTKDFNKIKDSPDVLILSDKENVSSNSKWILSKNSKTYPFNVFLPRFKHKLNVFHPHKPPKLDKTLFQTAENQNYIFIKEKLYMVLYDKHFSPKLSIVKLMYTVVDGFWD
ncbi:uncharacterized protein LOC26527575 isoform X2 [Drosophila mojavensis]|uniref:Uncharacterized protein, isoform A n=1 Tax=Drosophila mojavensis TaxID=7230 RepID=A0A0Q9XAD2_DROMO|nr:uncharacterized protein LOC26527575 isoform X2 [Drosophila mojavensis]KRG05141.1 uncharacterized protein Dmoj_GI25934, isoform A [Drosophila mojavensis]